MPNLRVLLIPLLTVIGSIDADKTTRPPQTINSYPPYLKDQTTQQLTLVDGEQLHGIVARAGCYEHFPETDAWYKLQRMPVTFQEAALRCSLEGAILASPLSNSEEVAMRLMMDSQKLTRPVLTGIHATFAPREFVSLEGISINDIMTTWASNEPDNSDGKEDCITMSSEGDLADVRCSDNFPYLCKRTDNAFHSCGTHDQGYDYDQRTNSCYKFHTESVEWQQAFVTCQAEGGHLAVINSDQESQVLKELYAKYPENKIRKVSQYFSNVALVGFHDRFREGHFMTVHGETLEKAGFAKFSGSQPNDLSPGQDCGCINRNDGQLNDFWCTARTAAFICEKSPGGNACKEEDINDLLKHK